MQSKPKALIANRGEIAVRAVQTCRTLGIESVAVYSAADSSSPHVWLADHAVCIGPAPSRSSYLQGSSLVHVALKTGCTMIYPGYGFLAENAEFARLCDDNGIKFVGPTAACIETMGDKARARATAAELGVPVVPGSTGAYTDSDAALAVADEIGYPMLLKASAGGGGRGMRVVEESGSFSALFEQAANEAQEAFSDRSIYLERYFSRVRHIEVQVFADQHGNTQQLGERDCSTQRRHQKLVEESPSPILTEAERNQLLNDALKLVQGVGYEGAGTVEFIFDQSSRQHFFIEMNTRIQVEHPVTEVRVNRDLVIEQFRIAQGEPLDIPGPESWSDEHVIEFRINAEDPNANFMPSPGKIEKWRLPAGPGIRVDTFVYEGMQIQPFYDSMIAKLIISGSNRSEALARARTAFSQLEIRGVKTTCGFHQSIIDHPDFIASDIYTRWVEQSFLSAD